MDKAFEKVRRTFFRPGDIVRFWWVPNERYSNTLHRGMRYRLLTNSNRYLGLEPNFSLFVKKVPWQEFAEYRRKTETPIPHLEHRDGGLHICSATSLLLRFDLEKEVSSIQEGKEKSRPRLPKRTGAKMTSDTGFDRKPEVLLMFSMTDTNVVKKGHFHLLCHKRFKRELFEVHRAIRQRQRKEQ